ncbi:acylphosphatase [Methylopila henanensis]|uniref:acylphosphatase n=1 Tax=Methylopila henanensis TaxID=873516 RepID=A0ABW4K350_9HYPH
MSEPVAELVIKGRVQGVSFRVWAQATATSLGLRGLVRNRRDGSVQAIVTGPEERIAAFAEACRAGPPAAEVDSVERRAAAEDALPELKGVEIARTE